MAGGTLYTLDTLAAASVGTVAQLGEDRAFEAVDAALRAHNQIVDQMLAEFVTPTTDRLRRYGGDATVDMDDLDQYGTPYAAKIAAGATLGFPLWLRGKALQWTKKYFEVTTPREFAAQVNAIMDADVRRLLRDIKRGLFLATNYTFSDDLVDGADLAVKALINADSTSIPPDPDGNSFNGATHTHYNFTASTAVALADFQALVLDVAEHFSSGELVVYINKAQETAVKALTGFEKYTDPRIILGSASNRANKPLDVIRFNNRAIGILEGAEVWVKPWVPAGYLLCFMRGAAENVVAFRTRNPGSGGLGLDAEVDAHPLRARAYSREYGIGVYNRVAAAILFIDAGAAGAYVAPTIS